MRLNVYALPIIHAAVKGAKKEAALRSFDSNNYWLCSLVLVGMNIFFQHYVIGTPVFF
jgi:hypothetical protein